MGNIALIIIGIICGIFVGKIYTKSREKVKKRLYKEESIKQYDNIASNIVTGNAKFKSKINNIVILTTKLPVYGDVEILYEIDKQDISILKDNKILFNSENIDSTTISNIIRYISQIFSNDINKKRKKITPSNLDIESMFSGLDIGKIMDDILKGGMPGNSISFSYDPTNGSMQPLNTDVKEQKKKIILEMDAILDRINEVGYDNLTKEEKDFLDNQNK